MPHRANGICAAIGARMLKLAFASACLLVPTLAHADSYRAETIAVDATSVAAITVGVAADTNLALPAAGIVGITVGSPVVHAVRGRWDRAGGSLALRLGAATLGGLVGANVVDADHCSSQELSDRHACNAKATAGGILAGLVVASVIDATFMTNEPAKREWAPQIVASHRGVQLGFVREF